METTMGKEALQARAVSAIRAIRGAEAANGRAPAEDLAEIRARIDRLAGIRAVYESTQQEIAAVRAGQEECAAKRRELQKQKDALGVFAGKEKKRLSEEIAAAQQTESANARTLAELKGRLGGYPDTAAVEKDLTDARTTANLMDWFFRGGSLAGEIVCDLWQALGLLAAEPETAKELFRLDPLLRGSRILAAEALRMGPHIAREVDALVLGTYRVKEKPAAVPFQRLMQQQPEERVPIRWRVLKREENRLLLISECTLDARQFARFADTAWDKSEIRKWLNGDWFASEPSFFDAFTKEDAARIVPTKVPAHLNPKWGGWPGEDTEDKVFLLSIEEARTLFRDDADRICKPSALAVKKAVGIDKNTGNTSWWLRTNGCQGSTAFVDKDGSIQEYGFDKTFLYGMPVRPAMWITV